MSDKVDEFAPDDAWDSDGWNTDEHCPWCKKLLDEVYSYADTGVSFNCEHCEKPIMCEQWTQFILTKAKP